jgi:hypothetical protein
MEGMHPIHFLLLIVMRRKSRCFLSNAADERRGIERTRKVMRNETAIEIQSLNLWKGRIYLNQL